MGANPAVRAARHASKIWLIVGGLVLLVGLTLMMVHVRAILLDNPEALSEMDTVLWIVSAALLIVGGAYGVYRGSRHILYPQQHPFLRALTHYGDPLEVVERIEKDRSLDDQLVLNVHLTPNWLIYTKNNNYRVMRYDDVVWLYREEAYSSGYGRSYSVHIFDKYNMRLALAAQNQNQANTMLDAIAERAPWAIKGHKKKTSKAWKSEREALIADVEKRRLQSLILDN